MKSLLFVVTWAGMLAAGLVASACTRSSSDRPAQAAVTRASSTTAAQREVTQSTVQALPRVVVHKDASCGCCARWVEHVRKAGFYVDVRNVVNMNPIKERVGVPVGMGSCHTAEVGGYFVEGHVPASDIKRLLAKQPAAKGLVLPGMPAGSPGMERSDGRRDAYTVELVAKDGTTSEFSRH